MTDDRFPDVNIKKLDFSQFHPLDHWMFTPRCYEMYGGPRTHWRYGWDFKWEDAVRRQTLCRVRRHDMTTWYTRNGEFVACRSCGKRKTETKD